MELRTLYYFLTVAREENITRAAKTIHIGQPALSRQLMQLEDEIGVPLFIRGKRKIQLTKAGMLLRRRAEEILNLVAKTEEELQLETTLSGELMLGLAECLASHQMLPKVIESFSQQHPEVTYNFYSGNADLIKERLDQGLIDVGIVLEPVDNTSTSDFRKKKDGASLPRYIIPWLITKPSVRRILSPCRCCIPIVRLFSMKLRTGLANCRVPLPI